MKRKLFVTISIASLVASLFTSGHISKAQEFRVEGAGLEADPTSYSGPCPGVIKFKGKIQASAAGRVKYTYLYSDGGSGPEGYVDFEGPGIKYVETTWRLGDPSVLPHFEGWATLKTLSPNIYESNKAKFVLDCKQGGAQPSPSQPQPTPNKGSDESNQPDLDLRPQVEKQLAVEKQRRAREAEILKSLADRLAPEIEAAEKKTGFDRRAIEDEFKAISAERDEKTRAARYEDARKKFEPQIVKLYEVAGINVAEERQKLINALGLQNARIRPSPTLTLEIEGEPIEQSAPSPLTVPPEREVLHAHASQARFINAFSPQESYVYSLRAPFLSGGVAANEGMGCIADRTTGHLDIHHVVGFAGSVAGSVEQSAWLLDHIEAKPVERRVDVTAQFKPAHGFLHAFSSLGYASSEAFLSLSVVDSHRLDADGLPEVKCQQRFSVGRVITVVFGVAEIVGTADTRLRCDFSKSAKEGHYSVRVMIEGYGGAGGIAGEFTSIWGDLGTVIVRTSNR